MVNDFYTQLSDVSTGNTGSMLVTTPVYTLMTAMITSVAAGQNVASCVSVSLLPERHWILQHLVSRSLTTTINIW